MAESARWWEMRPALSRQPKTYVCPFCHRQLLAMNPNTLLFPEGDRERRRPAHTECVMRARRQGRLPLRDEVEPRRRGLLRRLLGRIRMDRSTEEPP